jgi:hypothetical protein
MNIIVALIHLCYLDSKRYQEMISQIQDNENTAKM